MRGSEFSHCLGGQGTHAQGGESHVFYLFAWCELFFKRSFPVNKYQRLIPLISDGSGGLTEMKIG